MDSNQQSDLQRLKDNEEKMKSYQQADTQENQNHIHDDSNNDNNKVTYRSLAYKVRNPFRGI